MTRINVYALQRKVEEDWKDDSVMLKVTTELIFKFLKGQRPLPIHYKDDLKRRRVVKSLMYLSGPRCDFLQIIFRHKDKEEILTPQEARQYDMNDLLVAWVIKADWHHGKIH